MKKIKTKTITFHTALNYGAILQTIGLQKALQNLNVENEVIHYSDKCMRQYNPTDFRNLKFKELIKKIIRYMFFGGRLTVRMKKFTDFINNNINLTTKVNSIDDIEKIVNINDVLITGSDQVWSTEILGELSDIYTLNFNNSVNKKISYAASIGSSKIDSKYIEQFKYKVGNIDKISVREITLKNELKRIGLNKNIDVVLDPTMLLTCEQWNTVIKKHVKETKEKYIVAYTLDVNPEYIKIVNYLSELTGLKVIYFDYRNFGFKNVLKNCYCDTPYEFINYIKNAEYVVTTSFHGTVFSLIFNKKIWVIPHRTRGARMIDLLDKLNLSFRTVKTLEEFKKKNYDEDIDYVTVNKLLEKERKKSIDWLEKSINS